MDYKDYKPSIVEILRETPGVIRRQVSNGIGDILELGDFTVRGSYRFCCQMVRSFVGEQITTTSYSLGRCVNFGKRRDFADMTLEEGSDAVKYDSWDVVGEFIGVMGGIIADAGVVLGAVSQIVGTENNLAEICLYVAGGKLAIQTVDFLARTSRKIGRKAKREVYKKRVS